MTAFTEALKARYPRAGSPRTGPLTQNNLGTALSVL